MIESEPFTKPRDTGCTVVLNVHMATSSSGLGTHRTEGAGDPDTRRRRQRSDMFTPTIQWMLVMIVGLALLGAIIYFGSDIGDGGGGVNHSGLAPAALVDPPPTAA